MKYITKKQLFSSISMLLLLSIVLAGGDIAAGQQVSYINSYIYIAVNNGVIGLGQDLTIITWTADVPIQGIGQSQSERGWRDIKIIITDPDGVNSTFLIKKTDSIGSGYYVYTPTEKTGTYTAQAYLPAHTINSTTNPNAQSIYSDDYSPVVTFQVQNDPVPVRSDAPVPQDYWTRPIATNMHAYYALAGNWLGGAANQWPQGSANEGSSSFSYSPGPGSAHILWTKPYWAGGMMDDRFDSYGFAQYHYQGLGFSAIVIDGKVHYQPRITHANAQGWAIVDLYTGETLYENYTDIYPSFGQIYNYESPNQHGGFPYLYRTVTANNLPQVIRVAQVAYNGPDNPPLRYGSDINVNRSTTSIALGTIWEIIDAHTMQHVTYIANVSSSGGTAVYGKDGSILRYNTVTYGSGANAKTHITIWNASSGTMVASADGTGYWQWRPAGGHFGAGTGAYFGSSVMYNMVHNGGLMYTANFSISPSLDGPRNSLVNQTATLRTIREGEYAIFASTGRNDERGAVQAYVVAVDLSPGNEGRELWHSTLTPPYASTASNASISLTGVYSFDNGNATVVFGSTKMLQRWGFDAKTGEQLWNVTVPQADYYGFNTNRYQNMLLSTGYGGVLIAIDLRTGYAWNYTATNNYLGDSVFGNYPMNVGGVSNDGKIFIGTGQHSPGPILETGNVLQCINASNGALLWNFPVYGVAMPSGNAGNNFVIADGRLLALNAYDNQIYCFGRGPSATTVSAPQTVLTLGGNVTIIGTVTDQTESGRRNTNDKLDFSLKGTPAISDADQNEWMQHLFQQGPIPENAKGVLVALIAIDPNGNLVPVGVTTSDASGNFGVSFKPEVPGTYHITASFAGSEAYGPSSSTTYLTVAEAATPTPPPTETQASIADTYIVPALAGIVVAIVLSALALVLLFKKRP